MKYEETYIKTDNTLQAKLNPRSCKFASSILHSDKMPNYLKIMISRLLNINHTLAMKEKCNVNFLLEYSNRKHEKDLCTTFKNYCK
jgi:hypothetical protein